MTTLTVGTNEQYSTIAAAVSAAQDGDTVLVDAGTYTNDFFTITHKITVQSVGGIAYDVATVAPTNGKAIATVDTDATIDGFGFTGAKVSDGNGAGIRYEGGNFTLKNSLVWGNQDGILGAAIPNGSVTIQDSEFGGNGNEDGFTHNIYIGAVASFTLTGSYIHDAAGGHEVKSRALSNTIENNRIYDNAADGSYSVDLPNGGTDVVADNVIEKGVNTPNYTTIHFGGEGTPYAGSSLSVTGNTVVNDNANGVFLTNQSGLSTVTASGNQLWNFTSPNNGAVSESGETVLKDRPTLDTSTKLPATAIAPVLPPPAENPVPDGLSLQDWGPAGAVTASGHVLVVGVGRQFATLSAALAASQDGDTIDVMAGDYVNDFGTSNHKVIIQGVGGIAHFMEAGGIQDFPSMLQINNDATLANLSFTGATDSPGHAGGIEITAGHVTVRNSSFSGNDQAMLVDNNPLTTLSIYGTDIFGNGNWSKDTNNLTVGSIGSLTIKNSYIHDAITGHEVADYAYYSDIENNRIMDGPTAGSSFAIDLGNGGNALVANNVIEKGANAQNGVSILAGGEQAPYANTDIRITGNTFVSDLANAGHPYTYFIDAGQASKVAQVAPTTVTGNTFVGGVPGSAQTVNVANASGNTVAASATLDTAAASSAALAPATPPVPPAGPDTLVLALTASPSFIAGAEFTVAVDGTVVGGGTVTARDGIDPVQTMAFSGSWGSGSHTVTVTDILPSNEGSAVPEHLYVDGVALDGVASTPRLDLNHYAPSASVTVAAAPTPGASDFDAAWYLAHNPDVAAAGVDPLQHFLQNGWKEHRDPSAFFSTGYYLERNPDVAAAGVDPLLHYEQDGWKEGRDASGAFSTSRFLAANPDWSASGAANPLAAFMTGANDPSMPASDYANPESRFFDAKFYLASNPDIAAAHVDPLAHYEVYGWKEGRNPSASFDTMLYEKHNTDVAAAGIDPLAHYATNGVFEGRATYAVPVAVPV